MEKITNEQLDSLIKSAVNSSGPLPHDEKFSQIISALRELRTHRNLINERGNFSKSTNHPAHGPVSLDRLHQILETLSKASAQSDGGNLGYAMADAVKVIDEVLERRKDDDKNLVKERQRVIDGLCTIGETAWEIEEHMKKWDAEHVAMKSFGNSQQLIKEQLIEDLKSSTQNASGMFEISEDTICAVMYMLTTPPSPASVPDKIPKMKDGRGYKYVKDGVRYSVNYASGWNACRAAMLQAGNYPVTPDGWQLVPKKITLEMECAISRADSYEIGWQWALAAAPKYEVKS